MDYFCDHFEMCFETLWQVMIRNSVWYLVLSKGWSQESEQCTFDNSLAREYTIEDPKRKLLSKGVHLQVPKELPLREGKKREFLSQKGDSTILSTGRKR